MFLTEEMSRENPVAFDQPSTMGPKENNVTVGMVFLAVYFTQQRCLSLGSEICGLAPDVLEPFHKIQRYSKQLKFLQRCSSWEQKNRLFGGTQMNYNHLEPNFHPDFSLNSNELNLSKLFI